jgi:uncharacterized membrane protein SpoIIM required for sporulation
MIRNYLRIGLLFFAVVLFATMFYFSGLETKSYNTDEVYKDYSLGGGSYHERTRMVLITENANTGSTVVALGIIVSACLVGVAVLSNNDSDKVV